MKKTILAIMCFALVVVSAHAGNILVPTQQATIQGAINAAIDGDTITLTNSATYQEDLSISKRVFIVASPGQTPLIQNGQTVTDAQLKFLPGSGGTKFGSLTGGRIKLQYRKLAGGTTTGYYQSMIMFDQTTGTQVTLENLTVNETPAAGVTATTTSQAITMIIHNRIPNTVNLRYCDFDCSRSMVQVAAPADVHNHWLRLGAEWNDAGGPYSNPGGAPTYNMDHIRFKNYQKSGILPNFKYAKINMSYCDAGVNPADRVTTSRPWGSIYNGRRDGPFIGNFDHTIFRGSGGSNNIWLSANGTTVTMSRCVLVGKYVGTEIASTYGNLYLGGDNANGTSGAGIVRLVADHCDFVDMSTSDTTWYSAITRPAVTAGPVVSLAITNSNIYSYRNAAVNVVLGTGDSFTSNYNNVYGAQSNTGYAAGARDVSMDPIYMSPLAGDVRYTNNTLKRSDSTGGAIGVNASYIDPPSGILPGGGPINRALGWTILK